MGWTSYHATPTYKKGKVFIDRKAECDAYFMEGLNRGFYKVLKSSMVGSTYYAAVMPLKKCNIKDENGECVYVDIPLDDRIVFAAIFLTSVDNKDYNNFAYKNMDETCGPCEDNCPKGILDLLTPIDSEYANDWRKRCYENLKKKHDPNTLSNLPIGSMIKYKRYDGKEMTLIKCDAAYQFKRPWWKIMGENKYVSIKYIPSDYEVIKKGE